MKAPTLNPPILPLNTALATCEPSVAINIAIIIIKDNWKAEPVVGGATGAPLADGLLASSKVFNISLMILITIPTKPIRIASSNPLFIILLNTCIPILEVF